VWNVSGSGDAAIETGVAAMVAFFHSLNMPTRLSDYGISAAEAARKVSERFAARNTTLGEHADLGPKQALAYKQSGHAVQFIVPKLQTYALIAVE
jgi:NADP-dependent alcohol dehydrogenase